MPQPTALPAACPSNVGIASNIKESCLGLLVEKEVKMLAQGVDNPAKPFVAIIGVAKVSDEIGAIEHLLTKAGKSLSGGVMAYTFFASQGHKIGKSVLEEDKISVAKEFLQKSNGKIILPVDSLEATQFADVPAKVTNVPVLQNLLVSNKDPHESPSRC